MRELQYAYCNLMSQADPSIKTKAPQRRRRARERQEEQYRAIAAELSTVGYVLQGSITKRWMTCGRASCGCLDDPDARHGPYYSWTYKRGGKTISVYLSREQARLCADWIKNNRRLERTLQRLRALSRRIAQLEQIPTK